MQFKPGDRVYYTGSSRILQLDYGKRELTISAIDPKTRRLVCSTSDGRKLVGVNPEDIEYVLRHRLQGAHEAS
jgi:hypothetical protein